MCRVAWDVSAEKAVSRAAGPAEGGDSGSSGGQIALASCVVGDARDTHDGRHHVLEIGDGSYFVPSKANTTLGLPDHFFSFKDSSLLKSTLQLLRARVEQAKSAAVQSVIQKQVGVNHAAANAKILRLSIPMDNQYNEYPKCKRISQENRNEGDVLFFPIPSLAHVAFPSSCTELYLDNHSFHSFESSVFPADLTVLSLNGNAIFSLAGAKFPSSLTTLFLNHNKLSMTSAFPSGLMVLSLKNNGIRAIKMALPASCTELYLDENEVATIAGVAFPERLSILSLKKNKISSVEGAVLPASCTLFDVSSNRISSFEGVVFPAGCRPIISDQQLGPAVIGHHTAAGDGAVAANADCEEVWWNSEGMFQFSKWMPATAYTVRHRFSRQAGLPTTSRGRKIDPCHVCFVVIHTLMLAIGLVYDVLRLVLYKLPLLFFFLRGCTVDPLNIPPSKRVVFNGYIYATAHFHDVDDASLVEDGTYFVSIGAGFEVAPGDDDDVAVCNAHAWGSRSLAFADNFTRADTSLLENNIAATNKGTFAKFCAKRLQGHVTDCDGYR